MARRPTQRQIVDSLIERWAPFIRQEFIASINDLAANADLGAIIASLRANDIEAALRAVHIDAAVFQPVSNAITAAYNAGGSGVVGSLPTLTAPDGARVVLRFDMRNPRAEAWLTEHSSEFITELTQEATQSARQTLTRGMQLGNNPRTTGLDLVGRLNRATGLREGGTIGLTSAQERYVDNAFRELTSNDPRSLQHYLTRAARDKRFDSAVIRAIESGQALPRSFADRATRAYSSRLLRLRGETIGRTESMASIHASQNEAYEQAIDSGAVRTQEIKRTWRTARDRRVRDSHARMNGEVRGMNEPFSNGVMFPGDPKGRPEEIINCRCALDVQIDFAARLRERLRANG